MKIVLLRCALAALVAFLGLAIKAQDSNGVAQPSQALQADASDITDELSSTDDLTATNEVDESNSVGQASAPGPDGRSRRLQRQKRARPRSDANHPNGGPPAKGANGVGSLDYSAFRLVTERNIFDPNRQPHSGAHPRPKTVESFTLVGTMSYGKGDFAFFDGTTSEFKKVLKTADTIAGYKVVSIQPDSVKLQRDSKDVDLQIGTQLRKQEDGAWVQAGSTSTSPSSETTNSIANESNPSGAEDDVVKRLMQRRAKENSQ